MSVAMILAAGRGERLRPLTDIIPKALCSVLGIPLIEHHVLNLVKAGFTRIVINHSWLGGQIRHHLGNGSRWGIDICYSAEPPGGLETGGGIVKALPLLGNQPFVTVNADIYTDFDFKRLLNMDVKKIHVVLVPANPHLHHYGDFGLNGGSELCNTNRQYTFPGIACYHPSFFANCGPGRYSVTPLIRESADHGEATAQLYQGIWYDIGSMDRLAAANSGLGKHDLSTDKE